MSSCITQLAINLTKVPILLFDSHHAFPPKRLAYAHHYPHSRVCYHHHCRNPSTRAAEHYHLLF